MTHAFLLMGDCVEVLRTFPDDSIDAVVTDPPYGLGKHPDMLRLMMAWLAPELRAYVAERMPAGADLLFEDYTPGGGGFMNKKWDACVPGPEVWREVWRVLKPGGHLLAFFGSRTVDLGGLAIRIAGFEVRDLLAWLYGQGFPKSLNVALAIDKAAGVQGDRGKGFNVAGEVHREFEGVAGESGAYVPEGTPGAAWQGWGTALKPALEPVVLARKPLAGTVAANVLEHGTGGLNVDACRITPSDAAAYAAKCASVVGLDGPRGVTAFGGDERPRRDSRHERGRWPANVLFDEDAAQLLDEQTGDAGDPSRFFYVAKAGRREREAGLEGFATQSAGELTGGRKEGSAGLQSPRSGAGRTSNGRANSHPTVKPLALMRWLVRLITPPGGTVLDPFAGAGSTGCAAVLEGFHFVGCELSEEYVRIAEARIAHWRGVGEAA